jgi:hypothetical protein
LGGNDRFSLAFGHEVHGAARSRRAGVVAGASVILLEASVILLETASKVCKRRKAERMATSGPEIQG